MKFLSLLLIRVLNCTHYVPDYIGPNWELSNYKKYDRHADMCMILERMKEYHAKEYHSSTKFIKSNQESVLEHSGDSGFSMELDCM